MNASHIVKHIFLSILYVGRAAQPRPYLEMKSP